MKLKQKIVTDCESIFHTLFCSKEVLSILYKINKISVFLFVVLFLINAESSFAQKENLKSLEEEVWLNIENQIDKIEKPATLDFIFPLVRSQCKNDFKCLSQTYFYISHQFEVRFDLRSAIFVLDEIVKVASKAKDKNEEARAHLNLFRYYSALGNNQASILSMDRAEILYEEAGNQRALIRIKSSKLENSIEYKGLENVLPELEAMLQSAIEQKDTQSITHLHYRQIHLNHVAGDFEKMKYHVDAMDNIPVSDPMTTGQLDLKLIVNIGRGDLAKEFGQYEKAVSHYTKAAEIADLIESRWLEVRAIHLLAESEWKLGKNESAKRHIEKSIEKSKGINADDLLSMSYSIKTEFAEAEEDFEGALLAMKNKLYHEEQFEGRGAGFDAQRFYLEKEKERQQLELRLKESQLNNSFILIALGILLIAALFWAFYTQRNGKKELARQNGLIQNQAERLKKMDAAKSRFFANVSHELRTPLTLVLGPINSVLKSDNIDGRNFKLLSTAKQNGKELLKLVSSILDLSKLENEKLFLKEKPEQLFSLTRRLISNFESYAQRSGIDLIFDYQIDQNLFLLLDKEKIEIILNNLLSNALKFTDKGGKIEVKIKQKVRTISFSVSDSGRGIHPNDLPNIFDRFYQSEERNAAAEGGTGIGLALCKELVYLMKGEINVNSKIGEGSTFKIEIPKKEVLGNVKNTMELDSELIKELTDNKEEVFENKIKSNGFTKEKESEKPTILLVEDNYSLRDFLKMILRPNYQVITAENGHQALDILSNKKSSQSNGNGSNKLIPSLIISDVMMPVMDGFQFLNRLKSDERLHQIPVIMLTARADLQDKLKALRIGVDDYILKPFDEEELQVRIENLLKNQQIRKEVIQEELPSDAGTLISEKDRKWLEEFESFVFKNLSNQIISVPMLARNFAMSESSLLRHLKKLTGLSPAKYLQEMRLAHARKLLESRTYESIQKVASKVGYADSKTFSRSFKKRYGKLPSEFINT